MYMVPPAWLWCSTSESKGKMTRSSARRVRVSGKYRRAMRAPVAPVAAQTPLPSPPSYQIPYFRRGQIAESRSHRRRSVATGVRASGTSPGFHRDRGRRPSWPASIFVLYNCGAVSWGYRRQRQMCIRDRHNAARGRRRSRTEPTLIRSSTAPSLSRGRRACLLYTSPSPRDVEESRMPSSA